MAPKSNNPFALTDCEKQFTCDDWAWQFLKLSPRYKLSFLAACEETGGPRRPAPGPGLSRSIKDPASVSIAGGGYRECAKEFGLAAFLDPKHKTLPALTDQRSWFFPTTEFTHIYTLDEYESDQGWRLLDRASHPHPYRAPFGYVIPHVTDDVRLANPEPHTPSFVCVPIDCSVSPHGQLEALAMLAKSLRAPLVAVGRVTARDNSEPVGWRVSNIADNDGLSRISPSGLVGQKSVSSLPLTQWRAVSIDVLAPVKKQIEACRQTLLTVRQQLYESLDKPLWPLRFPSTIRQCPEPDHSYLKALLSLAQHPKTSTFDDDHVLANKIAQDVGIRLETNRYLPWLDHFLSVLPLHIRRARALINGEHRLLVHGRITAK